MYKPHQIELPFGPGKVSTEAENLLRKKKKFRRLINFIDKIRVIEQNKGVGRLESRAKP